MQCCTPVLRLVCEKQAPSTGTIDLHLYDLQLVQTYKDCTRQETLHVRLSRFTRIIEETANTVKLDNIFVIDGRKRKSYGLPRAVKFHGLKCFMSPLET